MQKKSLIKKIVWLGAALLIATTSAVGITLAMYFKTQETTDNSSVAKFGITMSWTDGTAFEKTYATDTTVTGVTNAVTADSERIAPGTTGSITLTLDGSSEVAFNLTLELVETYSSNWKVSGEANADDYKPITLTVTSTIDGANVSLTQNKGGTSTLSIKDFDAGATISGTVTITWAWAFEDNDSADNYVESLDDATYGLTAKVTATQIN